jgi:hypothetical protein
VAKKMTMTKRLECLVPDDIDEAITARARELAGTQNPIMFRSRAARDILIAGIRRRNRARIRRGA